METSPVSDVSEWCSGHSSTHTTPEQDHELYTATYYKGPEDVLQQSLAFLQSLFGSFDRVKFGWFIKELLRRSRLSSTVLKLALFYARKLSCKILDGEEWFYKNPKKIVLICIILASKFLQDKNFSMKGWSKISGLSAADLSRSELRLLGLLEFNIYVGVEEFATWCAYLVDPDCHLKATFAAYVAQVAHKASQKGSLSNGGCNATISLKRKAELPETRKRVCS